MIGGYVGKVLWVDLSARTMRDDPVDEQMAREYVGGYGIGARILYERMPSGAAPLGPQNILGFLTGPLTGTPCIEGNRSVVVCKSPLTGGWGDSNCGGTFGATLKFAGYDGAFFTGCARTPVYLLIEDGKAELRDAADLWGLDANEAERVLQTRHGRGTAVAVIGQAGEKLARIAAIMNDEGRAWGRSGVGAVMGSKNLKAIAVRGTAPVPLADRTGAESLRRAYMRRQTGAYEVFHTYGTVGITGDSSWSGDSPVKNWAGAGTIDFPTGRTAFEKDLLKARYQDKKYGCWKCTIACGGHMSVKPNGVADAPYVGTKHHKAEYETACAFGTLMLNDNFGSVMKANELCNRFGLDTISAGATIAFAMDCYGRGILTNADTDGIELTWGNHAAILTLLEKMGRREGFGDVLADGVKVAAERIGRGSAEYAIHVGGQEVAMHDPRYTPGLATTYQLDATPGRHTQGGELVAWPGEEMPEKYRYDGRGAFHKQTVAAVHFINAAGVCLFGYSSYPIEAWPAFMSAVTGDAWGFDQMMRAGERIANIRHAFNLREGINELAWTLPPVIVGQPPLPEGNVRGITVDAALMAAEYVGLMEWDPVTGVPTRHKLEELNLGFVARDLALA